MEATHITANPRSGKLRMINYDDDDDDDDDDEITVILANFNMILAKVS